jgi:uncharacterized protein
MTPLTLSVLPGSYTVHRFAAGAPVPAALLLAEFFHISRTPDELSVLCSTELALDAEHRFGPLAGLRVRGPLDFSLIGILADLTKHLAAAGLSVFAISSYDTDFLFVRQEHLKGAIDALEAAGHLVEGPAWPD